MAALENTSPSRKSSVTDTTKKNIIDHDDLADDRGHIEEKNDKAD